MAETFRREDYYLTATISGNRWYLSARLPTQSASFGPQDSQKVTTYEIDALATDGSGRSAEARSLFSVVPVELILLDANYVFSGTDFSPPRRNIREADLNRFIDLATTRQGSSAVRFQAVADGVTRLLVVAKGYDYGTLSFQNGEITNAFPSLAGECNKEFENRLDTTAISETIRRIPSDVIRQQLIQDQINSRSKFTTSICTTGLLAGSRFTHVDVDSPATNVYPYKKDDGEYYWFAIYKVPSDISPHINSSLGHLSAISAKFSPGRNQSEPIRETYDSTNKLLALKRPPVILVHGLNDEAKAWDLANNKVLQNAGFDVRALDYRSKNGSSFYDNRLTLLGPTSFQTFGGQDFKCGNDPNSWGQGCTILDIFLEYRARGIAISQVDVVGHSMGGLLARVLAEQDDEYISHHNFKSGYIHRLVTIGTPHLGSNIANIINADFDNIPRDRPRWCGGAVLWWNKFDINLTLPFMPAQAIWKYLNPMNGNRTALAANRDLAINSDAIMRLESTKIPSHAITATTEVVSGLYQSRYSNLKICPYEIWGLLRDTPSNFVKSSCAGWPCDLVVTQISQIGGLKNANAVSYFPNTNHTEEISSIPIREKVRDLLLGGEENFEKDGFPAPSSIPVHPPISLGLYNPPPNPRRPKTPKSRF